MAAQRQRLGEILVGGGVITEAQLDYALKAQAAMAPTERVRLGTLLQRLGVADLAVAWGLAQQLGTQYFEGNLLEVTTTVVRSVPVEVAKRLRILVVQRQAVPAYAVVVTDEPHQSALMPTLREGLQAEIALLVTTTAQLEQAWRHHWPMDDIPVLTGSLAPVLAPAPAPAVTAAPIPEVKGPMIAPAMKAMGPRPTTLPPAYVTSSPPALVPVSALSAAASDAWDAVVAPVTNLPRVVTEEVSLTDVDDTRRTPMPSMAPLDLPFSRMPSTAQAVDVFAPPLPPAQPLPLEALSRPLPESLTPSPEMFFEPPVVVPIQAPMIDVSIDIDASDLLAPPTLLSLPVEALLPVASDSVDVDIGLDPMGDGAPAPLADEFIVAAPELEPAVDAVDESEDVPALDSTDFHSAEGEPVEPPADSLASSWSEAAERPMLRPTTDNRHEAEVPVARETMWAVPEVPVAVIVEVQNPYAPSVPLAPVAAGRAPWALPVQRPPAVGPLPAASAFLRPTVEMTVETQVAPVAAVPEMMAELPADAVEISGTFDVVAEPALVQVDPVDDVIGLPPLAVVVAAVELHIEAPQQAPEQQAPEEQAHQEQQAPEAQEEQQAPEAPKEPAPEEQAIALPARAMRTNTPSPLMLVEVPVELPADESISAGLVASSFAELAISQAFDDMTFAPTAMAPLPSTHEPVDDIGISGEDQVPVVVAIATSPVEAMIAADVAIEPTTMTAVMDPQPPRAIGGFGIANEWAQFFPSGGPVGESIRSSPGGDELADHDASPSWSSDVVPAPPAPPQLLPSPTPAPPSTSPLATSWLGLGLARTPSPAAVSASMPDPLRHSTPPALLPPPPALTPPSPELTLSAAEQQLLLKQLLERGVITAADVANVRKPT